MTPIRACLVVMIFVGGHHIAIAQPPAAIEAQRRLQQRFDTAPRTLADLDEATRQQVELLVGQYEQLRAAEARFITELPDSDPAWEQALRLCAEADRQGQLQKPKHPAALNYFRTLPPELRKLSGAWIEALEAEAELATTGWMLTDPELYPVAAHWLAMLSGVRDGQSCPAPALRTVADAAIDGNAPDLAVEWGLRKRKDFAAAALAQCRSQADLPPLPAEVRAAIGEYVHRQLLFHTADLYLRTSPAAQQLAAFHHRQRTLQNQLTRLWPRWYLVATK